MLKIFQTLSIKTGNSSCLRRKENYLFWEGCTAASLCVDVSMVTYTDAHLHGPAHAL
jgi:hypothetical protein